MACYRSFSQQPFWLVKAGNAQAELITLMMAAFHLGELVPGLWYGACSLTNMASWDIYCNRMEPSLVDICAFSALTSQHFCSAKGPVSRLSQPLATYMLNMPSYLNPYLVAMSTNQNQNQQFILLVQAMSKIRHPPPRERVWQRSRYDRRGWTWQKWGGRQTIRLSPA